MKLSLEIPTKLLPIVSNLCDVDFILAQVVLDDDDYGKFYSNSTRFKIMDNGFHERGEPMTCVELKEAALLCKPDVIIAPDWYGDRARTFEGFKEAKRRIGDVAKIGTIMQGKDVTERMEFFNAVRPETYLLGFPYRAKDRFAWFLDLVQRTPKYVPWPPKIHLFGVSTLAELADFAELCRDKNISDRVSVDTAKPIKFGLAKEAIDEKTELQGKGLIDHKAGVPDAEQLANIFYNIAFMRKYM
jgi:hypothetical protein